MRSVYLDHMSATATDQKVVEEMLPFFSENFGSPSSHLHGYGLKAKKAVDESRSKIADLIQAKSDEIIFTSTGSEANNLALRGIAHANKAKGKHIVISEIEHFSVLYTARELEKEGFRVTYLKVDKEGVVNPDDVAQAITDDTILVSIMHANNEIGVIQPIEEIGRITKNREVIFHSDAVATAGIIPVNVSQFGVDALSLASQPFYGPKGIAALYLREDIDIVPIMSGGAQEGGRRPGTDNVPGIVGMGKAAEIAKSEMDSRINHLIPLRDRIIEELPKRVKYLHFTGHLTNRLPGHVSFWISFAEGETLVLLLNYNGISTASGSACSSPDLQASHVLTAIGVPPDVCHGSITVSLGKDNNEEDVDYFLETLPKVVDRCWQMSPLYEDELKREQQT
ncbi:MAG: cysteine desulfurase [Candidatus Scalindua sp. AMX11]|nr:MAG: cysteine desulfurase [Candidatus Scalindua sp.]NOG86157.1 cysteine desulfurase [Planctomycetota bacterium]RZV98917.1 MAG: cysteine desulfurase [Candidatus Scalindua sp. SCAELEC01]TDE66892.1 MAG: cysteine desulfurase [Candidatus Scalindua sp. AMX11]GJQ57695.1 MAG: cysteine desulfurase IscS [Candidatus Scalindua sp.]